ncbi:MAG: hydroxyacid dehydrogenase [Alphaproteobacteria bacterium]|nr:hydroxyacid dehydrogenase [Alphaproteobacteria bacterium]
MKKNHHFPSEELPVLTSIIEAFPIKEISCFDSIAFICVQHLLFTTFNLIEALIQLGACPDNIHLMGKSYSSCSEVVNKLTTRGCHYYPNSSQKKLGSFIECFTQDIEHMWRGVYHHLKKKKIRLIVILDDGGSCLANVPNYISKKYSLVGVEQTTSGLTDIRMRQLSFPVIEVASSAAKQLVESPMIAEAVVKKLSNVLPMGQSRLSCGVVGLGAIGNVIIQKLLSLNHDAIAYDKDPERGQNFFKTLCTPDIKTLFSKTEYIFGCAGEDITKKLKIENINTNKTFISCSSQDKEFLSLLKILEEHDCTYDSVLDHLECSLNGYMVKIYRGGFPINLDNTGESVSAQDIQLTRGLLLGGVLQGILYALHYPMQKNKRYMLHPAIQSFVVSHWMNYGSTFLVPSHILEGFQDQEWVKRHSKGTEQENELIANCFHYKSLFTITPVLMRSYG